MLTGNVTLGKSHKPSNLFVCLLSNILWKSVFEKAVKEFATVTF